MLVTSGTPVTMRFERDGGSIIQARIDVWKATPAGWQPMGVYDFESADKRTDSDTKPIPVGEYTCVCQLYIRESVNGLYSYKLKIGNQTPCEGEGDVNTTSAPGDSKPLRCQFVLKVSAS